MTTARAYLVNDVPVLGPIAIAVTGISNVAQPAIGADGVRHGLLFHNPNADTVLRVLPVGVPLIAGAGGIAIEPFTTFALYAAGAGTLGEDWSRVRINAAWQVIADTAGSWGLTVWDFTDSLGPVLSRPNLNQMTANLNVDVDIPSPVPWQFTGLTTATSPILPFNLNRRGLLVHNPGTAQKAVAPGNLAASIGAGSIVILPHGQFELRAGGKIRANAAFNAATADPADGLLTALEYV